MQVSPKSNVFTELAVLITGQVSFLQIGFVLMLIAWAIYDKALKP